MGMDQQLFARFYTRDKASKSIENDGCPVDIPLSADPACGIRHFENVKYIMIEMLYWRRNEGVHEFLMRHCDHYPSNDCGGDVDVPASAIMDLRDELLKLSRGEKSELTEVYDCYLGDDGEINKDWVISDANVLDKYLHMGDKVEFVYSYGW